MRARCTVLIVGSDTGVGKTQVAAGLARTLHGAGFPVRLVKPVETGAPAERDADRARRLSGAAIEVETWLSFRAPLSPPAAAAAEGGRIDFDAIVDRLNSDPLPGWLLVEGAGGIGSPIDESGRDWADLAAGIAADFVIVVVPDRLGAINQARLALARARESGCTAGIWLNATAPVDPAVAASTRAGLRSGGIEIWGEQDWDAVGPRDPAALLRRLTASADEPSASRENSTDGTGPNEGGAGSGWLARAEAELSRRDNTGERRRLSVASERPVLNLADNDYLDLARDPAVIGAVESAVHRFGASAAASPLIVGWKEPHAQLVESLCRWHRFPCGLLWSSGYAANTAVLGTLPAKGDVILADRLIHHSMIAGILKSGARFERYRHLDLDDLEARLKRHAPAAGSVFVATESVFSMDGDRTDLRRLAELKRRHGFCWVLDEAHALGWYGPEGAGLARAAGVEDAVDILVGTLGKTLATGGAYTLFRSEPARDYLINCAGEFIYSTAIPPASAAGALAALERVRKLSSEQDAWHRASRQLRVRLLASGWNAPEGDSPIIPVRLDDANRAVALAAALRAREILVSAVRPPTVPAGTSRLRLSLKRGLGEREFSMLIQALAEGGGRR